MVKVRWVVKLHIFRLDGRKGDAHSFSLLFANTVSGAVDIYTIHFYL